MPESFVVETGKESIGPVWLGIFVPFLYHWRLIGAWPSAATLKVTGRPTYWRILVCCMTTLAGPIGRAAKLGAPYIELPLELPVAGAPCEPKRAVRVEAP